MLESIPIFAVCIALLLGILAGCFTGLAPGIHINLIAALLIASLANFPNTPVIVLAVFIASMSITHTFLDFIPSIFLGAPEEDTFLSILPGHEMLKQGKGQEAVILTLYGSVAAIPIILIFTPIFIAFLPSFYSAVKFLIPFILIFISFYLIFREDNLLNSLVIFLLSGFLGFASFNLPIKDPLLPLLTGLFGTSSLLLSLKNKDKITPQKIAKLKEIRLPKKDFMKAFFASFFAAPLCSFLPGISSSHAATIGSEIIPQSRSGFLFLNGAINTIIMGLSFITVYAIGRARSGSAAAVQSLLNEITLQHIIIILTAVIVSAAISFFIGIYLAKFFSLFMNKINYRSLSIAVIIILIAVNIAFSLYSLPGLLISLLILLTSTFLGVFAILSNSKRINLMGALIVPAIVYYLI